MVRSNPAWPGPSASAERDTLSVNEPQGGARAQGDATVQQLLAQRISELEAAISGSDRQAAVKRKKQLRTVAKLCADAGLSAEAKLLQLQTHFIAQVDEHLKADRELQALRKEHAIACRDRDLAQSELKKANSQKDTLSEICRKLQKDNKQIREASQKLASTEAAIRCESRTQVDATLASISAKLEEQAVTSSAVATENDDLRGKLLKALESIDIREQHAVCQAKSKGLEVQLAEARQRQAEAATAQVHAQAAVAQASADARDRCAHQELTAATAALTDYQDTVTKSSEVLTMMKEQLDDRTVAVEKMMRERRKLRDQRDRGAALTASLVLENAAYKKQEGEMARLRTQNSVLEGLCRRLRSGMVDSHASPLNSGTDAVDSSSITAHA